MTKYLEGMTLTSQRLLPVDLPDLLETMAAAAREATYQAAVKLVAQIDEDLTTSKRHHYRDRAGVLLTTLDEVVLAILADDLVIGEPTKVGPLSAERWQEIQRNINIRAKRQRFKRSKRLGTIYRYAVL